DDFLTMGVVGNGVGLVQHEHELSFLHLQRTFQILNPLTSTKFTAAWKPPITSRFIIEPGGVSRSQGTTNVAVFAFDNSGGFTPLVFSSNVAANTFGPVVPITDSTNFGSVFPPIAYDSKNNKALL